MSALIFLCLPLAALAGCTTLWLHVLRPALVSADLAVRGALLSVGLLVLLGFVWPSLFTIAAPLALPAVFLLVAELTKASGLQDRRRNAYYLFCVTLSAVAWSVEVAWVATRRAAS